MGPGPTSNASRTDEERWRELAMRALEGRPLEALTSTTVEGLRIEPLYTRSATEGPRALRQRPGPWKISQRIDHPDPGRANAAALADLQGGADALTFAIAGAPAARGFGVSIRSGADLDLALDGMDLDLVPLRIDAGDRALEIARHLGGIAEKRRLTSAALDVDLGHDPIGHFARMGATAATPETLGREAASMSIALRERGFCGHLLLVDSRPYHEARAGESQELACTLATGLAYLRLLGENGLALEAARKEIAFLLAADADAFLTLAKFRALRRLWARVEVACGLSPRPVRIHAETSFRMMTARDPWTNLYRATIAAFSAGTGGADGITTLPFTLALGLPDDFARRLARNTQLILIHEAGLARVADPAAGSGAFETLTRELCERAWGFFQGIERQGGMFASLEAGLLQAEIAATASARDTAIANGSLAIIGTSIFPDLAETPVHVLETERMAVPEPVRPAALRCTPLPARRDAEPFEALRKASDAILARTGRRPNVFLCTLAGNESDHSVAWIENLFSVAGVECSTNPPFPTAEEAAAAFRRSGCKIACLRIQAFDENVILCADALREAGACHVYFAASREDDNWRLRGGTDLISPGCHPLAILESALAHAV